MFSFQDARDRVEVAFTDRHGGTSGGPYASLNLATAPEGGPGAEDDPDTVSAVRRNLRTALAAFGRGEPPPAVLLRQVHGAHVHLVRALPEADDPVEGAPAADGVVTDVAGVVLVVRAADCVPVLLADPKAGVVGAAHAGRAGLVAQVVPRTVAAMRDLGATSLTAWVGPHICGRCYEVPAELRAAVAETVPSAYAETSWGTPALDVGGGVVAQLEAEGVTVVPAARCTREDEDLYSYRRQGRASGRLGGLVWMRP